MPKTSCFMGMEGVVEWQRILKKLLHMIEPIEIYRINRWQSALQSSKPPHPDFTVKKEIGNN